MHTASLCFGCFVLVLASGQSVFSESVADAVFHAQSIVRDVNLEQKNVLKKRSIDEYGDNYGRGSGEGSVIISDPIKLVEAKDTDSNQYMNMDTSYDRCRKDRVAGCILSLLQLLASNFTEECSYIFKTFGCLLDVAGKCLNENQILDTYHITKEFVNRTVAKICPDFYETKDDTTADYLTTEVLTTDQLTTEIVTTNPITTDQPTSGIVTTDQLTSGVVTTDQLTSGVVTTGQPTSGIVTTDQLTSGVVTTDNITIGIVTTDQPTSGAVTIDHLTTGVSTTEDVTMVVTTAEFDGTASMICYYNFRETQRDALICGIKVLRQSQRDMNESHTDSDSFCYGFMGVITCVADRISEECGKETAKHYFRLYKAKSNIYTEHRDNSICQREYNP